MPGIATWRGTEYADIGSLTSPNQMVFQITGKMSLPRIGRASTKTRTVRAKFAGTFYHAQVPLLFGVKETFVAGAVATVTLTKIVDPLGKEAWIVTSLSST